LLQQSELCEQGALSSLHWVPGALQIPPALQRKLQQSLLTEQALPSVAQVTMATLAG
jgi:hypothetical protein